MFSKYPADVSLTLWFAAFFIGSLIVSFIFALYRGRWEEAET
jgi:hypothetical protein